MKAVFRGNFIAQCPFKTKLERFYSSNLTAYLEDLQQKEALEFKYVDAVQVSISKVDQKMADQQREMLIHEIKLAKNVQDPSIFELLKGEGTTKKVYVNELAIKYEIIDIKRSINLK